MPKPAKKKKSVRNKRGFWSVDLNNIINYKMPKAKSTPTGTTFGQLLGLTDENRKPIRRNKSGVGGW